MSENQNDEEVKKSEPTEEIELDYQDSDSDERPI